METCDLTGRIIGCAMSVHTALGPGLLENVYKECLFYKFQCQISQRRYQEGYS